MKVGAHHSERQFTRSHASFQIAGMIDISMARTKGSAGPSG